MGSYAWSQTPTAVDWVATVETGSKPPSICPISLPRIIHIGRIRRGGSNLHRVFMAPTDLHKPISLIFHALLIPICTTSVEGSPVPRKLKIPLIFRGTTPRYRTNPGPMSPPPSIWVSWKHLITCFLLPCTRVSIHRRRFQSCWSSCSCD